MNSQKEISDRLLKLFPVKSLKEHFMVNEVGETLYREILNTKIKSVIEDFAYSNLDLTKQHIYIYDIPNNRNNIILDGFPYEIEKNRDTDEGKNLIISPFVDFKTVLTNPFEELTIRFKQPIKIVITRTHLIFYVTILEKNISTYFENNRKVLNVEKYNDEHFVIKNILEFFALYRPNTCDVNKGIKELWNQDVVDCKYAQWKKSKSTTTETMDENYTLKSQYPEVYQGIVSAPIRKTVFKYLPDDDEMPEHFTVDPGIGQISIPLFPKTINQNQNVVKKILSNN